MIGLGLDKKKKVILFFLYNGRVSVGIVCCVQLNILSLRETAAVATSPIDIISSSSLTSNNLQKILLPIKWTSPMDELVSPILKKATRVIIIFSSISQNQQLFIVAKVLQTGVRYLVIEGIWLGLSGFGGEGLILDLTQL